MKFTETKLKGAFLIEIERIEDERGFFARSFCRREFEQQGLNPNVVQCSLSYNRHKGTLRGMHYQAAPHQETKIVRCVRGAIYDVIVDLRHSSPTFRCWLAATLTSDERNALYVPEGFAHGFYTLTDDTEVMYQMAEFYYPESARGLRWDDPALGIRWPGQTMIASEKDLTYPYLEE